MTPVILHSHSYTVTFISSIRDCVVVVYCNVNNNNKKKKILWMLLSLLKIITHLDIDNMDGNG